MPSRHEVETHRPRGLRRQDWLHMGLSLAAALVLCRPAVAAEPLTLEAGAVRFRPIVLTAAALIVGALVILLDPIFQGLAISLIFGIFAATALTLIVIPLLYYMVRQGQQDGGCASETEQGHVP